MSSGCLVQPARLKLPLLDPEVARKLGIVSSGTSPRGAFSARHPLEGYAEHSDTPTVSGIGSRSKGGIIPIAQRSDRHLGRSQRGLELSGWIGPRSIDLPSAWARPHEDVVVAFDRHSPTNWKAQSLGGHTVEA